MRLLTSLLLYATLALGSGTATAQEEPKKPTDTEETETTKTIEGTVLDTHTLVGYGFLPDQGSSCRAYTRSGSYIYDVETDSGLVHLLFVTPTSDAWKSDSEETTYNFLVPKDSATITYSTDTQISFYDMAVQAGILNDALIQSGQHCTGEFQRDVHNYSIRRLIDENDVVTEYNISGFITNLDEVFRPKDHKPAEPEPLPELNPDTTL